LSCRLISLLILKTGRLFIRRSNDDLKPDDWERSDKTSPTGKESFMTTELYVGNLPLSMSEDALRDLLLPHGAVTDIHFGLDRTKRGAHRFAFVTMAAAEGVAAAIFGLNGREVEGRELRVNQSRPPGERSGMCPDASSGRRGSRG
jgi:cold-inducible RNA-binding protein